MGREATQLRPAPNRGNAIGLMDAPGLTKIGKEFAAELINQNKYEYILMGENFKSKFLVNDYETVDNFSTIVNGAYI